MKFIELTGIDEKPILFNPEQITSVYESSWTEEINNSYYDPVDGRRHSYPRKTRHECTRIVCGYGREYSVKDPYSVVKLSLLEGATE